MAKPVLSRLPKVRGTTGARIYGAAFKQTAEVVEVEEKKIPVFYERIVEPVDEVEVDEEVVVEDEVKEEEV